MSKGDIFGYHYQVTAVGGKLGHWNNLCFNLYQVSTELKYVAERNQGEEFTLTIVAQPQGPRRDPTDRL